MDEDKALGVCLVWLIWSWIDDWALARMMCVCFATHLLYVYIHFLSMYGLGYSLNSRSNMPYEIIVCNLGHNVAIGLL